MRSYRSALFGKSVRVVACFWYPCVLARWWRVLGSSLRRSAMLLSALWLCWAHVTLRLYCNVCAQAGCSLFSACVAWRENGHDGGNSQHVHDGGKSERGSFIVVALRWCAIVVPRMWRVLGISLRRPWLCAMCFAGCIQSMLQCLRSGCAVLTLLC